MENGGDLTQVIPIDTKDEVGDLARATNRFVLNIRTIMTVVMEQARVLGVATEQISAGTEQMAAGASSQANEIQSLTDQISEMASAAEEVAASSEETSKAALAMAKDVQEGKEIVEMTSVAMKGIGDNIYSLDQRSEKIGEIIRMINDIASQTNLLALNAAIEAARAGDVRRSSVIRSPHIHLNVFCKYIRWLKRPHNRQPNLSKNDSFIKQYELLDRKNALYNVRSFY